MAKGSFWGGFGLGAVTGATVGLAAYVAASGRASSYNSHILRLERSIQIGRPVEDVFAAWSDLEYLGRRIASVQRVAVSGDRSEWTVLVDGRLFQFDAETLQVLPNQAIGWKSIRGPKHSGRVNFARLGDDTLVHLTMNYAPPLGRFGRLLAPVTDHLESELEAALRDFKRALEDGASTSFDARSKISPVSVGANESASDQAIESWGHRAPASAGWDEAADQRATGTDGIRVSNPAGTPGTHVEDRQGNVQAPGAVDYTRPPKDRY